MDKETLLNIDFQDVLAEMPFAGDFFESQGLEIPKGNVRDFVDSLSEDTLEDLGIEPVEFMENFVSFVEAVGNLTEKTTTIKTLRIIGGLNKTGEQENVDIEVKSGEVICIVGPTGSGKSRLLADIEWMAMGDTPTKRHIKINGVDADKSWRFSPEHKPVAQLSQNMNFVMDLSAREFVMIHAESRFVQNPEEKVELIIKKANELAGEQFSGDTPVTALSGGQSRALMIADTAFLSKSPIVLIDEIENAGIDRKKALELLVGEEKIVLMSTHDPILALMGDKRLVIKNGGISKVINTSDAERANLVELQELDRKLLDLRNRIRTGETLEHI
ncbi:ABC transporter related protein [Denitrovibrio acetiphilus DSM 12809]|uniref:ABC transporter related protein n=1 Tax=Denitrovibrio acetiphilus (strain DSM 12809 / NBRC 114555 / N2460) TaxID=522772 RepID=D4H1M8_DENA2|nr:ATP-binding cassette domain-containing protein [Denitrovibrio acetiphilus]ADD68788.1 ABC transporter related protein [Denitrovibrio acetiphilus DSM 12809]